MIYQRRLSYQPSPYDYFALYYRMAHIEQPPPNATPNIRDK